VSAVHDAAIAYAELGLADFPLHPILPDGRCGCGNQDCGNVGKHPATTGWPRTIPSASAAEHTWREDGRPERGIGVACGPRSGCFGLDVDPRHGGHTSLAQLVERYGRLPRTWAAQSGSGEGLHVFFAWPDGMEIRNSAGKVGPGLDVRGEGGFMVLPPSLHRTGGRYRWLIAPDRVPLAPAPGWLVELSRAISLPPRRSPGPVEKVPRGQWHNALVSLLGRMRHWGACFEVLDAAAVALAKHQFQRDAEPIDWAHVHATAADIARRY
jgi:Bifunctional DNA primase/polymerase, N-terminal